MNEARLRVRGDPVLRTRCPAFAWVQGAGRRCARAEDHKGAHAFAVGGLIVRANGEPAPSLPKVRTRRRGRHREGLPE